MYEEVFDIEDYSIFMPYVNIGEQAEAQRRAQAFQEQLHMESQTASGLGEDRDLNPQEQAQSQQQVMSQMNGS